jgi:hypothetical protein
MIMNDIGLIEKYAKQRRKYRSWDVYAKDTDLQRLGRLETTCWTLLMCFGLNLSYLSGDLFEDRILPRLAMAGYLAFMGYLMFEINRTNRLRSLFENTTVQNATDLIEILKRAPSQAPETTSESMQGMALSAQHR